MSIVISCGFLLCLPPVAFTLLFALMAVFCGFLRWLSLADSEAQQAIDRQQQNGRHKAANGWKEAREKWGLRQVYESRVSRGSIKSDWRQLLSEVMQAPQHNRAIPRGLGWLSLTHSITPYLRPDISIWAMSLFSILHSQVAFEDALEQMGLDSDMLVWNRPATAHLFFFSSRLIRQMDSFLTEPSKKPRTIH